MTNTVKTVRMTQTRTKKIYEAIMKFDEAGRDFVEAIHNDSTATGAVGNYAAKHKSALNALLDAIGGMDDYKVKEINLED